MGLKIIIFNQHLPLAKIFLVNKKNHSQICMTEKKFSLVQERKKKNLKVSTNYKIGIPKFDVQFPQHLYRIPKPLRLANSALMCIHKNVVSSPGRGAGESHSSEAKINFSESRKYKFKT